ncbi:MAG: hypothetical protein LC658_02690 [Bacteroidales bacterium]|nr:hypothetical protein [Bacteroidales bacterium]
MKRNYFIIIGTLFLLLVACEKKIADQKRIFHLMEKSSKSITILEVKSNFDFTDFAGKITLSDNELEFRFLHENRTFYSIRFHSIDKFSVGGTFCAKPGFRKIESSSFDWVFALFLIVFALRGGLGFRDITAKQLPK